MDNKINGSNKTRVRSPVLSPRRALHTAIPKRYRNVARTVNVVANVIDDEHKKYKPDDHAPTSDCDIPPLSSSDTDDAGDLLDDAGDLLDVLDDANDAGDLLDDAGRGGDAGDLLDDAGDLLDDAGRGGDAKRRGDDVVKARVHAPNRRFAKHVDGEAPNRCIESEYPQGTGRGRVLAYVRRSAEDRRNRPLAAQFETIKAYVRDMTQRDPDEFSESDFVHTYFVDNGISGTTQPKDRPAMSALMELVSSVGRMHVVAYDTTRIARSVNVGNNIRTFLENKGATIHLAQSRMVVEGNNADMIFGIGLQVASSERTNTIMRIRSSFRSNPNWDTRRSFGWRMVDGKLVEHDAEQACLSRMRTLFEEGKLARDIAAVVSDEFGLRTVMREDGTLDESVPWEGANVSFFAKKYGWTWGASAAEGRVVLTETELATRALAAVRAKTTMENFLNDLGRDAICDGIRINRAMLRRFFTNENPPWKCKAIDLARTWVRQEKHSIDDIANMLDENAPRPRGAWTRQTAWRLVRHAEKLNDLERRSSARTARY